VLYIDPATLFPSPLPPAPALTRSGIFSSGIMLPPGVPYSQVIGDITPGPLPYECLLHDASGMTANLVVLPR
jgi:hypothetical protein